MSLGVRMIHDYLGLPLLPRVQRLGLQGLPMDNARRLQLIGWAAQMLADMDMELSQVGIRDAGSGKQLSADLRALGVPLEKKTPGGEFVTDLDVLRRFHHHFNEVRPSDPKFPFLVPLIKRKKVEKTRANLTSMIPCRDGRLRTALRSTGTETGRYSSAKLGWCQVCNQAGHGTNLQNIAKKDESFPLTHEKGDPKCWRDEDDESDECNGEHHLREVFKAPRGEQLISWDYHMLELRTLAYLANVRGLIANLEAGVDIHNENEQALFGTSGVNRTLAKNFVFASLYGGGKVAIQIALSRKGIYLEQALIEELQAKLFQVYPEIAAWQISVGAAMDQARGQRVPVLVRNAFGRVRVLLGSEPYKEGLATINSGTAADIMSFNLLRFPEHVFKHLCIQIHDDFVGQATNQRIPSLAAEVKEIMESDVWMAGRFVKFPVEVKVGQSWDAMHAYP